VTLLYVALGAALGAPLRLVVAHALDARLPWGTILVNVAGSFVLGVVTGLGVAAETAALVGTGFCGALTTYSAFALQTYDRGLRDGLLVVLLTVPPALAACAVGHAVGHAVGNAVGNALASYA
jgi:fluoride exporter